MRRLSPLGARLLAIVSSGNDSWADPARFQRLAQSGDLATPIEGGMDSFEIPSPLAQTVSVDEDGTVAFGTRGELFVFDESLRAITCSDSTLANFEPSSTDRRSGKGPLRMP